MSDLITLFGVTLKSSESDLLFDNFSLSIQKGELVLLWGPGGSGKSTLFQILTGTMNPDHGEVIVNGKNILHFSRKEWTAYRRSIGFVPQNEPLLKDRSVFEEIELPLELDGVNSARRKKQVHAILERFHLQEVQDQYPALLSMSERERLAIARAVVREPLILLADEPAAHLNAEGMRDIVSILKQENLRGMTILLGTADERFASSFPGARICSLLDLGHSKWTETNSSLPVRMSVNVLD